MQGDLGKGCEKRKSGTQKEKNSNYGCELRLQRLGGARTWLELLKQS